ncbi:hypothetical protein vseg_007789 [Gypsophila vaccaria]
MSDIGNLEDDEALQGVLPCSRYRPISWTRCRERARSYQLFSFSNQRRGRRASANYKLEMMRCLREVNVDNNGEYLLIAVSKTTN